MQIELGAEWSALTGQLHLVIVAAIGGVILFAFNLVEHFNRAKEDKLGFARYMAFFVFLFIGLPALGIVMVGVYLLNGDQLSPLLAFQVGLTSPAIVQSFLVAAANKLAGDGVQEKAGQ